MPFVNCKQCGKLNSVKLAKCPKCGFPLKEEQRKSAPLPTSPAAPAPGVTPPQFGASRPASAFGQHHATPTPPPTPPTPPPPPPAGSPFVGQSERQGDIPRRRNPYYTGK